MSELVAKVEQPMKVLLSSRRVASAFGISKNFREPMRSTNTLGSGPATFGNGKDLQSGFKHVNSETIQSYQCKSEVLKEPQGFNAEAHV